MMNAVARVGRVGNLLFSDAVVKTKLTMPEMPQAVPLRRRLRVEVVVNVIEDISPSPMDCVLQRRAIGGCGVNRSVAPIEQRDNYGECAAG